jgi:hypothetical protein
MNTQKAPASEGYEVAVHSNLLGRRYVIDEVQHFNDIQLVSLQEECQNNINYLYEVASAQNRGLVAPERGRVRRNAMMARGIKHELYLRREIRDHEARRQKEEEKRQRREKELEMQKQLAEEKRQRIESVKLRTLAEKISKLNEEDADFLRYYKSLGLPTDLKLFGNFFRAYQLLKAKYSAMHEIVYERYGKEVISDISKEAKSRAESTQNGDAVM